MLYNYFTSIVFLNVIFVWTDIFKNILFKYLCAYVFIFSKQKRCFIITICIFYLSNRRSEMFIEIKSHIKNNYFNRNHRVEISFTIIYFTMFITLVSKKYQENSKNYIIIANNASHYQQIMMMTSFR